MPTSRLFSSWHSPKTSPRNEKNKEVVSDLRGKKKHLCEGVFLYFSQQKIRRRPKYRGSWFFEKKRGKATGRGVDQKRRLVNNFSDSKGFGGCFCGVELLG